MALEFWPSIGLYTCGPQSLGVIENPAGESSDYCHADVLDRKAVVSTVLQTFQPFGAISLLYFTLYFTSEECPSDNFHTQI